MPRNRWRPARSFHHINRRLAPTVLLRLTHVSLVLCILFFPPQSHPPTVLLVVVVQGASFPARIPDPPSSHRHPSSSYYTSSTRSQRKRNNMDSPPFYHHSPTGGGGGYSDDDDDDEEEDEVESSSDFEDSYWGGQQQQQGARERHSLFALDNNNNNNAQGMTASTTATPESFVPHSQHTKNENYQDKQQTQTDQPSSSRSTPPIAKSSTPSPTSSSNTNNQNDGAPNNHKKQPSSPKTNDSTTTPSDLSQPLQTLQKLQQMLDETDYKTMPNKQKTTSTEVDPNNKNSPSYPTDNNKLWTSQDRSKYRIQQRNQKNHHPPNTYVSTPINYLASSDDDEDVTDEEDGGFTLPNLPVYHSDAESDEELEGNSAANENNYQANASSRQPSPPPSRPPPPPHVPPSNYYAPFPQQPPNAAAYGVAPPPPMGHQGYAPVMPSYHTYSPYPYYHDPRLLMYRPNSYSQAQPRSPYPPPYPQWATPPPPTKDTRPTETTSSAAFAPKSTVVSSSVRTGGSPSNNNNNNNNLVIPDRTPALHVHPDAMLYVDPQLRFEATPYTPQIATAESLAEASSLVNFSSIQKLGLMMVLVAVACYSGVSPRDLPLEEYNLRFYENCKLVTYSLIAPAVYMFSVFDARMNDINAVIHSFFVSFGFGYLAIFVAEIVVTTFVRLAVFSWLEPNIFELTPQVPVPVLPWVLREVQYRPKRITLFVADFLASCVASPIIEEYAKYRLLCWTTSLPKNFDWVYKEFSKGSKRRKRRVAEPIVRMPPEQDAVSANKIITQALAVSIGIKMADVGRRILLYTKPSHQDQGFYAVCRGLFPIHELCGTMTALNVAKRNLLGVDTPSWVILLPAIVIHGMANFRGMKVSSFCLRVLVFLVYRERSTTHIRLHCSPFSNGIRPPLGPRCSYHL